MLTLQDAVAETQAKIDFSGSVLVQQKDRTLMSSSYGFSNRSDKIKNNLHTRFGIASGCKLFTAIAVCQLVEQGKLSFQTRLTDCLNQEFPHFNKDITVHHLLSHTSGVPDYFDEDVMDDFEELWVNRPMYHIRSLKDFLPMFQSEPMKSAPAETFHYNNAGYILLGLIVEQAAGMEFTDYVQEHIFKRAGMTDSGYFSFDALSANTALGYIDAKDGTWRTNIYSLPVKGGSDGGAYITVGDIAKLWTGLFSHQLLNEESTKNLLMPHAKVNETGSYGYGVWIKYRDAEVLKYHVMGYDPGVSFHSAYYPEQQTIAVVCSNKSDGAYDIMTAIEDIIV